MHYSIDPRNRRYVKGYGCLSFAKNIGKNITNKHTEKIVDSAKKSATDITKTASKRTIQKTAEATGDLICNTVDKITSVSNKSLEQLPSSEANNEIPKEDLYLHKKDNK